MAVEGRLQADVSSSDEERGQKAPPGPSQCVDASAGDGDELVGGKPCAKA